MPIQGTLPNPDRRRRRRRRRRRPPERGGDGGGTTTESDSDNIWHSPRGGSDAGEVLDEMPERDCCLSDGGVDLESGELEVKVHKKRERRDCRICHLRLVGERTRGDGGGNGDREGGGVAIELGCSCKGDLAAAHKKCAETWFKIRGNTTCEICGATAVNVVGELTNEANVSSAAAAVAAAAIATSAPPTFVSLSETQNFWHGRRLMNILLGCMIFAFIISWLFHFNLLSHH